MWRPDLDPCGDQIWTHMETRSGPDLDPCRPRSGPIWDQIWPHVGPALDPYGILDRTCLGPVLYPGGIWNQTWDHLGPALDPDGGQGSARMRVYELQSPPTWTPVGPCWVRASWQGLLPCLSFSPSCPITSPCRSVSFPPLIFQSQFRDASLPAFPALRSPLRPYSFR